MAVTAEEALAPRARLAGDLDVRVDGKVVSLSNLDKPYWPEDGYMKGDLIRYYYAISPYMLPYLKDRPLIMKRYPNGIHGKSFHQHDVDEVPDYVRTARLDVEEGHTVDYIIGGGRPAMLYMANLGAIERHPWHSRLRSLERPDWFVFDLDPGEGVTFESICEVAVAVREALKRLKLESYAKTSGSRGLHIYVPIRPAYSYETVARVAERVARSVAEEMPELATVERSLKKRGSGKVYVDYLQNARAKSVVAPYSPRPRPGATVSAPVEWRDIERRKVDPRDFTIKDILRRIERKGDFFLPVLTLRQTLRGADD